MEKALTTLSNENEKVLEPEWIYVIYDKDEVYLRECKTLKEVADFFKVSKQALANHLRRTGQPRDRFIYKGCSIEYFDLNGIY